MGSRQRRGTAVTAGIAAILLAVGAGCSGGVEAGSDPTGLIADAAVGFNVWCEITAHTYWFHKQDGGWVDVSPEDVGVTDTTVIT